VNVDETIATLTPADKALLCAGADVWRTLALPSAGIPALKFTDGPTGARGAAFTTFRSIGFPCGTAVGATFDVALAARLGAALAVEVRAKGASVLLGPTVNLHRTPLAGRNFECLSEDPHLTATLATAYIGAVQGAGVAACVKHFVCNDAEFERHSISSDVDERPLRELYLRPFEDAIAAGVWAVMTAYNRVNGVYASEHAELINTVLKGEWGFDGLVMSDWFGTSSTVGAALGGLDLEMPGPGRVFGPALAAAVDSGDVDEAVVDDKVRRLLRLIERTGGFDREPETAETSLDLAEHRALATHLAASSFVLLRNETVAGRPALPLDAARLGSLAVIGPNAVAAVTQGGGSSRILNHETVTPAEAIAALVGRQVDVLAELGCHDGRDVPILDRMLLADDAEVSYHPLGRPGDAPLHVERHPRLSMSWFGDPPPGVGSHEFTVVVRAGLVSAVGGPARIGVSAVGPWSVTLDGALLLDNDGVERGGAFYGRGTPVEGAELMLAAGRRHELVVRYDRVASEPHAGLKVVARPPTDPDAFERAVAAARRCDAAVVVVGTNDEVESEGYDRTSLALPGRQDELVAAVAAVNPNTIVVVNAGAPVTMPWVDDVAAALMAWFPGIQGSAAIADVLFGHREPTGRLPTTFPRRIEDTPSFTGDPGEAGHVRYGEGIHIGYRWYDARRIEPLFPFGHGLTYAEVDYHDLVLDSDLLDADGARLRVRVANTGERAITEVVQAYVSRPRGALTQPPKVLAGFAKIELGPREEREVTVALDHRAIRSWTPGVGWTMPDGTYRVEVGRSSRDIRLTVTYDSKGRMTCASSA